MSKYSKLLQVTEDEKKSVLEHHQISEDELDEKIEHLKEWLLKSCLPIEDDPINKFRMGLINCKLSVEKTKKCITGYYRVRTLYASIFGRMLPNTEYYMNAKSVVQTIIMPKLSPDLCRIIIYKFNDPLGVSKDGFSYQLIASMEAELRLNMPDFFVSNIAIIDFENFGMQNLIKFNPTINQKLVNIMRTLNVRIKNIHFVNTPVLLDRLMLVVKSILPGKFHNKVCIHKDFESLSEYIPKEYLPLDYNGSQPSIDELHGEWCKVLEENEDFFKKLLELKCQDMTELQFNDNDSFGVNGSFQKLAID